MSLRAAVRCDPGARARSLAATASRSRRTWERETSSTAPSLAFARAYADQNERDYAALGAAVEGGPRDRRRPGSDSARLVASALPRRAPRMQARHRNARRRHGHDIHSDPTFRPSIRICAVKPGASCRRRCSTWSTWRSPASSCTGASSARSSAPCTSSSTSSSSRGTSWPMPSPSAPSRSARSPTGRPARSPRGASPARSSRRDRGSRRRARAGAPHRRGQRARARSHGSDGRARRRLAGRAVEVVRALEEQQWMVRAQLPHGGA